MVWRKARRHSFGGGIADYWYGQLHGVKLTVEQAAGGGWFFMLQRGKDYNTADLYNSAWPECKTPPFKTAEDAQTAALSGVISGLPHRRPEVGHGA